MQGHKEDEVDGSGWREVDSNRKVKRRMSWDNARAGKGRVRRSKTIFFFTSFSNHVIAKDLFKVCEDYGVIDEVVIRSPRNQLRKKFGFVRLFDVREEDIMTIKLDNIFIDNVKLIVNLRKF